MLNKFNKETKPLPPKRAAIYFRVPSDYFSSAKFNSEKEECVKVAKALNYDLVNIYVDISTEVPGQKPIFFYKLIHDIRQGLFDDVIVYSISRVNRNLDKILYFLNEAGKRGVGIKSIKEQGDEVFTSKYLNERILPKNPMLKFLPLINLYEKQQSLSFIAERKGETDSLIQRTAINKNRELGTGLTIGEILKLQSS